jgi:hypothetical protein
MDYDRENVADMLEPDILPTTRHAIALTWKDGSIKNMVLMLIDDRIAAADQLAARDRRIAALEADLRSMLTQSKERATLTAPEDTEIERLCQRLGYGAVMDAAARLWRRRDPVGAQLIGGCIAVIERALRPTA